MTQVLGRLETVPLRQLWPHEANDFTPWLAEPDNLSLLADTLNLDELQVQGTEVPVGNFSIDILALDVEGHVVVIENQFGPTDHTHLGQILTYVAGQEGHATVVWIAEVIREEHRAAIDWLNASTIEGFDFSPSKSKLCELAHRRRHLGLMSWPNPTTGVVASFGRAVERPAASLMIEQEHISAIGQGLPHICRSKNRHSGSQLHPATIGIIGESGAADSHCRFLLDFVIEGWQSSFILTIARQNGRSTFWKPTAQA